MSVIKVRKHSSEQLINESELADILGMSNRYVQQLRMDGGGPIFHKLGRSVRYRMADVDDWLNGKRLAHTSEQS